MTRWFILSIVALPISWQAARPQTPRPPDPLDEVRSIASRPGTSWSDEDAQKVVGITNNLVLDSIFQTKIFDRQPPLPRPVVVPLIAGEPIPPYIKDGKIYLSVEYFGLLERLSYFLAHDILLRHEHIQVAQPLLQQPFASSRLLPLMQPFRDQLGQEAFNSYVSVFHCAAVDDPCDRVRKATYATVDIFVLSHELAHAFYGDSGGETTYPTSIEIRADRKAWDVLLAMEREAGAAGDREAQILMGSAGLLPISYQRQLLGQQRIASAFDERVKALTALMPANVRGTASRMVANRDSGEGTGTLRISWPETPDLLIVNGTAIDPSEAAGRDLLVIGGEQRIFARKGARFAFNGIYVDAGATGPVSLRYQDLKPTPAVPPEPADPKPNEPNAEWFDIFMQTSNPQMQPRNAILAMRHWEAQSELGLNRYIPADSEFAVRPSEKKQLREWHDAGIALDLWGRH
jgi:hypothetical protein